MQRGAERESDKGDDKGDDKLHESASHTDRCASQPFRCKFRAHDLTPFFWVCERIAVVCAGEGHYSTMRSALAQEKTFLVDAMKKLDEVLRRGADSDPGETKAARQMIQRWLAVFAAEHLADICSKLMAAAQEHAEVEPPTERRLFRLPQKADEKESVHERRGDDSKSFFILETLSRVLSAAVDQAECASSSLTLRSVPDALLPFCFERLGLAHTPPIRHVAATCVGLLSRGAHLKPVLELFIAKLSAKLSTDRDQREHVAYERASALLMLSTHSAEQAASSARYLRQVSAAMPGMKRGVLRAEVCASLQAVLTQLMKPTTSTRRNETRDRRHEWSSFCASGGETAVEWWSAYAAVYDACAKWSRKCVPAPQQAQQHAQQQAQQRSSAASAAASSAASSAAELSSKPSSKPSINERWLVEQEARDLKLALQLQAHE